MLPTLCEINILLCCAVPYSRVIYSIVFSFIIPLWGLVLLFFETRTDLEWPFFLFLLVPQDRVAERPIPWLSFASRSCGWHTHRVWLAAVYACVCIPNIKQQWSLLLNTKPPYPLFFFISWKKKKIKGEAPWRNPTTTTKSSSSSSHRAVAVKSQWATVVIIRVISQVVK